MSHIIHRGFRDFEECHRRVVLDYSRAVEARVRVKTDPSVRQLAAGNHQELAPKVCLAGRSGACNGPLTGVFRHHHRLLAARLIDRNGRTCFNQTCTMRGSA